MKKVKFFSGLIIALIINNSVFAQDSCQCLDDINKLSEILIRTPAYKSLTQEGQTNFQSELNSISKIVETQKSEFDCFFYLNRLALQINDNHTKLYGVDTGFSAMPKINLDLDSLENALISKTKNDIEGIYYFKNILKVGVYFSEFSQAYTTLILHTTLENWENGEVMYSLIPYGNNYLYGVGASMTSKQLMSFGERIDNGKFFAAGFLKDTLVEYFNVALYPDTTYLRKEISPDITYLKIGSFNSWYPTLAEAESFYKSLENTLTKKNLIIDLRNNGGGGDRNSDILFKILKNYLKSNSITVLTNNGTGSNAEQFAFNLSALGNCKIIGERTSGTLAHEIKNSQYNLPCEKFILVTTSKKHSKYLHLESQGIEPAIKLDVHKNWIDQAVELIESSN